MDYVWEKIFLKGFFHEENALIQIVSREISPGGNFAKKNLNSPGGNFLNFPIFGSYLCTKYFQFSYVSSQEAASHQHSSEKRKQLFFEKKSVYLIVELGVNYAESYMYNLENKKLYAKPCSAISVETVELLRKIKTMFEGPDQEYISAIRATSRHTVRVVFNIQP